MKLEGLALIPVVLHCAGWFVRVGGVGESENKKFTPKGEGGSGREASATENT